MRYQVTATFETDREMTADEIRDMQYVLRVQIEEPVVQDEYDFISSNLRTTSIKLELNQVGE